MKKALTITLALILAVLSSACKGISSYPIPDNAIFYDDFTQANSGWSLVQGQDGSAGYADGHFRISITPKNTMLISTPGKSFAGDVSVEVDVRYSGGPSVGYAGVLCHYQNPDNYYMFLITSDGSSGILLNKAGTLTVISPAAKFLKMEGIKTGKASNHIQADCVGDKLTLYANGTQVSLAYDDSLTGGDVGMVARSSTYVGGAEMTFDHFLVTKP